MWRWILIGVLILFPLTAIAQETEPSVAYIRLGHLAIGIGKAELTINDSLTTELTPLVFGDYFAVVAGEHEFHLVAPENELDFVREISFESGKQYTVFLNGSPELSNVGFNFVEEDTSQLEENASVRLYVYNALPLTDLQLSLRDFASVSVPALSYWGTTIPTNDYYLDFTRPEDESSVLVNNTPTTLRPFHTYFIGLTRVNDEPEMIIVEKSVQSQITLQHFLVDAYTFNVYLDELPIITDVGYQADIQVRSFYSNEYHLKIATSNLPDEIVVFEDESFSFDPDMTYTFYMQGQIDTPQFKVGFDAQPIDFWQSQTELASGEATQILLRNGLADVESIDLIGMDGTVYMENLRFGETGSLSLLAGAFDWAITLNGDPETVLFDLSDIELQAGRIYEIVAAGQLEAIQQGQQRLFVTNECIKLDGCE